MAHFVFLISKRKYILLQNLNYFLMQFLMKYSKDLQHKIICKL